MSSENTEVARQSVTSLGQGASKDVETAGVGITWEQRPKITPMQTGWLIAYGVCIGIFLLDGFICIWNKNYENADQGRCPKGWIRRQDNFDLDYESGSMIFSHKQLDGTEGGAHAGFISRFCMAPSLDKQWVQCMADVGMTLTDHMKTEDIERLKEEETGEYDMWDILGQIPGQIAAFWFIMTLVAFGWFFALKMFPTVTMYVTIGVSCWCTCLIGIWFGVEGLSGFSICSPFFIALLIAFVTYRLRHQVDFTCRTIGTACNILKNSPHILGVCATFKVCWFLALAFLVYFRYGANHYAEVEKGPIWMETGTTRDSAASSYGLMQGEWSRVESKEEHCKIVHKQAGILGGMEVIFFLWISSWLEQATALVCSVAMGSYIFHRDDPAAPDMPALIGAQWAFSFSAGSVSESSLMCVLNYYAQKYTREIKCWNCCCMCNPFWWFVFILHKIFQESIHIYSRFNLIMHGFHGGGVFTQGNKRPPVAVLDKHLGKALVVSNVGQGVLWFAIACFSTTVTFGVWISLAFAFMNEEHWSRAFIPRFIACEYSDGSIQVLGFFTWYILYFFLVGCFPKWTILFLFALLLMGGGLGFFVWFKFFQYILAAIFIGCVVSYVLNFLVDMVFYSTDGLVYCYVLSLEAGKNVETGDLQQLHELIQEVKAEEAETEPLFTQSVGQPVGIDAEEGKTQYDSFGLWVGPSARKAAPKAVDAGEGTPEAAAAQEVAADEPESDD